MAYARRVRLRRPYIMPARLRNALFIGRWRSNAGESSSVLCGRVADAAAGARAGDYGALPAFPLWISGTSRIVWAGACSLPIIGGLDSRMSAANLTTCHALSASIPRRATLPASGIGGGGQARPAQEGGARMEGAG